MDGFSFSIQTEIAKRNKDYGVRNTRLKNIFIKKGIVLFMYSGRGCGQNENVSYKLSFPFLEQPFNYYQAFNLYKNIEIRERIRRTLNRLEELMQLQDNWDGYGALKIEREAYENCKIYRPRNEGDSIAGYAQITAREVRQSSIESITTEVTSHPSKRNPFHAGISYTSGAELIKGHCMRPDFLIVTSTLALRCTFIPFDQ